MSTKEEAQFKVSGLVYDPPRDPANPLIISTWQCFYCRAQAFTPLMVYKISFGTKRTRLMCGRCVLTQVEECEKYLLADYKKHNNVAGTIAEGDLPK